MGKKTIKILCIVFASPILAIVFIPFFVVWIIDGILSVAICGKWRPFQNLNNPVALGGKG